VLFYTLNGPDGVDFGALAEPGLHQGIIAFWKRRAVAGTDDEMVYLLRWLASADPGLPLDIEKIRLAIDRGRT
jgi:hypothetical protein